MKNKDFRVCEKREMIFCGWIFDKFYKRETNGISLDGLTFLIELDSVGNPILYCFFFRLFLVVRLGWADDWGMVGF